MIDLHCHLLWNMDDGASSMEKTIALCEIAVQNHIQIIAATPHMTDLDLIDDFLVTRNQKLRELNTYLASSDMPVRVCGGAEVFLNEQVFTAEGLQDLTLNRSRYLLCEYSLRPFEPEKALIYAEEVLDRGLIPIIAHPERYPTFHRHPEIVTDLQDMGVLFQVNADSLAGRLGEQIQDFAVAMMTRGTADFIANDAHSPVHRNNDFKEFRALFPAEITPEIVKWATYTAPRRVLENKPLSSANQN